MTISNLSSSVNILESNALSVIVFTLSDKVKLFFPLNVKFVSAEIPIDASFSLVFASVLKLLTGLKTSMTTLIKTYCLMTVSSASLGFAIGSFTSSVESAMSTGLSIMVIFMVVGIINPSGVDFDEPPNWKMDSLAFFSPIKWAIESLVTAEFRGLVFEEKDRGL